MQSSASSPQLETLITEQRTLLQSLATEVRSLQRQVKTLRSEVRQQPMLGFSNGRDYIIIERDKNILWHRFENDEPVPIKSKILKGYIKQVVFVDKEYPKLHVFIEGDREYVLVTGFETYFAREVLAAIGTMKPEDLAYPVIIKPDTGSDDSKSKHKPVFCNIIHRGRTVKPGNLRNQDVNQLLKRAEAVLQQVEGEATKDSDRLNPAWSNHQRQIESDRKSGSSNVAQFPSQPQQPVVQPELPQIPSIPAVEPASTVTQNAVDWVAVCQDLDITSKQLKDVASSLALPQGKLSRSQSAQLYQEVYRRYGEAIG